MNNLFYTRFMWKEQTISPQTPPPSVLPSTHRERVSTGLENARWFCNLTCLSFSLSLSFCPLGRCQFLGLLISSMKLWEQQAPLAWMPSKACSLPSLESMWSLGLKSDVMWSSFPTGSFISVATSFLFMALSLVFTCRTILNILSHIMPKFRHTSFVLILFLASVWKHTLFKGIVYQKWKLPHHLHTLKLSVQVHLNKLVECRGKVNLFQ